MFFAKCVFVSAFAIRLWYKSQILHGAHSLHRPKARCGNHWNKKWPVVVQTPFPNHRHNILPGVAPLVGLFWCAWLLLPPTVCHHRPIIHNLQSHFRWRHHCLVAYRVQDIQVHYCHKDPNLLHAARYRCIFCG